jgi:hypothetical protein
LYLTGSKNIPAREAPSKKILDATGIKNLFYPSSIQSPEVKTEWAFSIEKKWTESCKLSFDRIK